MMAHRVMIFSPWVRLWHWANLFFMVGLVVSGLNLHFADPKVGGIDFNLAQRVHNVFGIALTANYVFFLVGNVVTGNWRQYVPRFHEYVGHAILQIRYYLWDIFFGRPAPFPTSPENHFNPLQKVAYLGLMYGLMPILIITGLLYLWPELAPDRMFGVDGLLPVAMIHYVVAYLIVVFMLVHIYLGTCGTTVTAHFKSMITGWHEG